MGDVVTDASQIMIAPLAAEETSVAWRLLRELARFEGREHEFALAEDDLYANLFGPAQTAHALLARWDGEPIGLALYYFTFPSFSGAPALWIEDLFVLPTYRGRGVGGALLRRLAHAAVERGCVRMEWWALDWNADARAFYEKIGARARPECIVYQLAGDALNELSDEANES